MVGNSDKCKVPVETFLTFGVYGWDPDVVILFYFIFFFSWDSFSVVLPCAVFYIVRLSKGL